MTIRKENNGTPETPGEKAQSKMTNMESSISDLKDQVQVKNDRVSHHFKPGWLFITILIMVIISSASFFAVTKFTDVGNNSKALTQRCILENERISIINAKFHQLVELFDASLKDSNKPPPSAEILKLYDVFKEPIKLQDCDQAVMAP